LFLFVEVSLDMISFGFGIVMQVLPLLIMALATCW